MMREIGYVTFYTQMSSVLAEPTFEEMLFHFLGATLFVRFSRQHIKTRLHMVTASAVFQDRWVYFAGVSSACMSGTCDIGRYFARILRLT